MALTYSTASQLGSKAPDFTLPGVDGTTYSLQSFSDSRALVVAFMCNHCPYVVAVQERINRLAREYASKGVRVVGINSNDSVRYPDDSFEAMQKRSQELNYVFPYLHDESQIVARAYGAVCTPDFYVYETRGPEFVLRYRGRLDDNWKDEKSVKKRDLAHALDQIIAGGLVPVEQPSSMGCSIKWKSQGPAA